MNAGMQLNLLDALRDEAFSHLRYQLFAKRAHESGRENLAHLFETTARAELEHFSELAQLYRLVGDDARNLDSARKGEEFDVETMYPAFADRARAPRVPDALVAPRRRVRELPQARSALAPMPEASFRRMLAPEGGDAMTL